MSAAKVIEEIKMLPRDEQSLVVEFAMELAHSRQLPGSELEVLAKQMVDSKDPDEKKRLKEELTRGFYGE